MPAVASVAYAVPRLRSTWRARVVRGRGDRFRFRDADDRRRACRRRSVSARAGSAIGEPGRDVARHAAAQPVASRSPTSRVGPLVGGTIRGFGTRLHRAIDRVDVDVLARRTARHGTRMSGPSTRRANAAGARAGRCWRATHAGWVLSRSTRTCWRVPCAVRPARPEAGCRRFAIARCSSRTAPRSWTEKARHNLAALVMVVGGLHSGTSVVLDVVREGRPHRAQFARRTVFSVQPRARDLDWRARRSDNAGSGRWQPE